MKKEEEDNCINQHTSSIFAVTGSGSLQRWVDGKYWLKTKHNVANQLGIPFINNTMNIRC